MREGGGGGKDGVGCEGGRGGGTIRWAVREEGEEGRRGWAVREGGGRGKEGVGWEGGRGGGTIRWAGREEGEEGRRVCCVEKSAPFHTHNPTQIQPQPVCRWQGVPESPRYLARRRRYREMGSPSLQPTAGLS